MAKKQGLMLEYLEDRTAPATFGIPWPDAAHLTLSFAPDRTDVQGQASNLSQLMAGNPGWQHEVLRAFQTWAVRANINIGVVDDAGKALGVSGQFQGDERFGDIRIATKQMQERTLATSMPFDWSGTTWAGDLLLNNLHVFGQGGIDLFSVVLHEAGHILGLDHSADKNSVMHEIYQVRAGLAWQDVDHLRDLYGARLPDEFEGSTGNETFDNATSLTGFRVSGREAVEGDITTGQDVDLYHFRTTGKSSERIAIAVRTAGRSLLAPRLTVYDNRGRVLASGVSSPVNGDVVLEINNTKPSTYYVKVEGGTSDVFRVGGYRLEISPPGMPPAEEKSSERETGQGQSLKDRLKNAVNLQPTTKADARYGYSHHATLNNPSDIDTYRIKSPIKKADQPAVLKATVHVKEQYAIQPQIKVYDSNGVKVTAEVLQNENGAFTVQVANPRPNAFYFLEVRALRSSAVNVSESYFLGADFLAIPAVDLERFATDTLKQGSAQDFRTLEVRDGNLFHFVFALDAGSASARVGSRMTIFDKSGKALFSRMAYSDEPASSGVVYLPAGIYYIRFTAGTQSGEPLPPVRYVLDGRSIGEDEGISLNDSTDQPAEDTNSTPPMDHVIWQDVYYYYTFITLEVPASDLMF